MLVGRGPNPGQSRHVRVCPQCGSIYSGPFTRCKADDTALVDQDRDPLIGRALDRYHIVERLGMGGMGCVYRARHAVIERQYAIKVLFGDYVDNNKFQARFRREATSISKIRHPNIVQVEDFGRTPEGLTFLAMELVHGETLAQRLLRVGPLPPMRAADIVRQLADGLDAAHQVGFVHRDVKPANVMLTDIPRANFVKLLDFGTVNLQAAPSDRRLTAVGHIIGTPTYMAPEQADDANVGPTADVYALGAILFELLTGTPPFHATTRAAMIIQHITKPPPPVPPSGGLEDLVDRMLRKDPSRRPQSMAEIRAALDDLDLTEQEDSESIVQARRPHPVEGLATTSVPTPITPTATEPTPPLVVIPRVDTTPDSELRLTPSEGPLDDLDTASMTTPETWGDWRADGVGRDAPLADVPLPPDPTQAVTAAGLNTMIVRERKSPREDVPSAPSTDAALIPVTVEAGPTRVDLRLQDLQTGTVTQDVPLPAPTIATVVAEPPEVAATAPQHLAFDTREMDPPPLDIDDTRTPDVLPIFATPALVMRRPRPLTPLIMLVFVLGILVLAGLLAYVRASTSRAPTMPVPTLRAP